MTEFADRMLRSASEKNSRTVLALDLGGPFEDRLSRAQVVLEGTVGRVAAVKVNNQLLLPFGLRGLEPIVRKCSGAGVPLVADLKMNDIESTNLSIVESLSHYDFDAVIANPFVGREEGLGRTVERAHELGMGVIFLVYMSHKGSAEGYGLSVGGGPLYREFAKRAKDWGADGIVVSANAPEKIREAREIVGRDCLIFSPGIGAQGGDPKACAGAGADFLIVGRAVTEAPDPAKALAALGLG